MVRTISCQSSVRALGKLALYFHEYGDALEVETNLGKKFVYYPIANKLYTDQVDFQGL